MCKDELYKVFFCCCFFYIDILTAFSLAVSHYYDDQMMAMKYLKITSISWKTNKQKATVT